MAMRAPGTRVAAPSPSASIGVRRVRPRLRSIGPPVVPQRMAGPPVVRLAPGVARTGTPAQVEALVSTPRPGDPLPENVRQALERTFDTDLSEVRFHTEPEAATAAETVGTRAFTYGTHVYLGRGERPTDFGLMAHEVTHVLQQQGAPVFQLYAGAGADRCEVEARQAAATSQGGGRVSVRERTGGPRVQGIPILDDIVDAVKDQVWSLLERAAPSLVPIFRKGVLDWLKEK